VITSNIHAKLSGSKDDRQQQQQQKPESLVVSVPLSSATTVPGIQLPTTNSSNSSSSSVSAIVTNQIQIPLNASPTMSTSITAQGSLYQHLTNNQPGNQRASPLIQQRIGRASPITSSQSLLSSDGHSLNNHTSVLQNMNAGTGGVISSAGFHGVHTSTSDSSPSGMLKVSYEKQTPSRIHAIQESSRRSRYENNFNLIFVVSFCFCCFLCVNLHIFSHITLQSVDTRNLFENLIIFLFIKLSRVSTL
jgi:hypothetical protein